MARPPELDTNFYTKAYGDVKNDPVWHFNRIGKTAGRLPSASYFYNRHPEFDATGYYLYNKDLQTGFKRLRSKSF